MTKSRKFTKAVAQAERESRRADKYVAIYGPRVGEKWVLSVASAQEALRNACAGDSRRDVDRAVKALKSAYDKALPIWRISVVREYAEAIFIALILALLIRNFIIQAFKIPSGSMIPTLMVGDHIIVNKFIYGFEFPFVKHKLLPITMPKRGQIIVFRYPLDRSKDYIKRLVGLPGDMVEMRGKRLYVNGREIPKTFKKRYTYEDVLGIKVTADLYMEDLDGIKHPILLDEEREVSIFGDFRVTVPQGKYFMMGDNRDRSNDSRGWGFVDFNDIRGEALIIYFSWGPRQLLRIGKLVR